MKHPLVILAWLALIVAVIVIWLPVVDNVLIARGW